MQLYRILCLLVALLPALSLAETPENARCIISIFEGLQHLQFANGTDGKSHNSHSPYSVVDKCTNPLRRTAAYANAKKYCNSKEIKSGLAFANKPCFARNYSFVSYESVESKLTDKLLKGLRVIEFEDIKGDEQLKDPVLLSKAFFARAYGTNKAWAKNMQWHRHFFWATFIFWGSLTSIGAAGRLVSYSVEMYPRIRRKMDSEAQYTSLHAGSNVLSRIPYVQSVYHWFRTYLIISPPFWVHGKPSIQTSVGPTRLSIIISLVYALLNLLFLCIRYDVYDGNLFYPNKLMQRLKYIGDRAGIMSLSNLLLLWLFGSRNNPLLWMTGWSFATFNLYHRVIARVTAWLAIVHSVAYVYMTWHDGNLWRFMLQSWWYTGIICLVIMLALPLLSSARIRRYHYELFLLLHIGLSVVLVICLYVHTSILKNRYKKYLKPLLYVWMFDRHTRMLKLIFSNIHIRWSGKVLSVKGTATYDEASDVVRLQLVRSDRCVKPQVGKHYYIYQPLALLGWQSHPFTLGSWAEADVVSRPGSSFSSSTGSSTWPTDVKVQESDTRTLVFWIRPYNGWTKRLRDACMKSPNRSVNEVFLLEGPYGNAVDLTKYENVLLIAGGTGISAALPHIEEHMRRTSSKNLGSISNCSRSEPASNDDEPTKPPASYISVSSGEEATLVDDSPAQISTRTCRMTLIWSAKQAAFLHSLIKDKLGPALRRPEIDMHFYCTGVKSSEEDDEAAEARPLTSGEQDEVSQADINNGRPAIKDIIKENVEGWSNNGMGRTAVLFCGPPPMAGEIREALHGVLKEGYKDVDYFEEVFGW